MGEKLHNYDRVDDDFPVSLRIPMDHARRLEIEGWIESGVPIEALMANPDIAAYFSDAGAIHPEDVQAGADYAA